MTNALQPQSTSRPCISPSQLLEAQNRILHLIAGGEPLDRILNTLAMSVDELSTDTRCAFLMFDKAKQVLRVAAAPGLPDDYPVAVGELEIGPQAGSCGRAAYAKRRVVVSDISDSEIWTDYRHLADRFGWAACWSEPVFCRGNRVVGTLAMFYPSPCSPSDSELRLIESSAQLAGIAIDRHQQEQKLATSEERFRQLAEHIDEVFWLADWRTRELLYVSPAYERVWQRSCASLYENPESYLDAIHPDDVQRVATSLDRDAANGDFEVVYRLIGNDGAIRWIRDRAFPIRDEHGEVYRMAGISEDITDQHLANQELRQRSNELAQVARVASLGELAAELAHELSQPLYAIANYADACNQAGARGESGANGSILSWTKRIADQAQRAGSVLRRIHKFVTNSEPKLSDVNINELVRETVKLLDVDIRANHVALTVDLDDGSPTLVCDETAIQQVLVNLILNSLDAVANQKSKSVQIRTIDLDDSVKVTVTDSGRGISDDWRELATPFHSTKPEGVGMGLAIALRHVEGHQGELAGRNRSDANGAEFYFTLPKQRHNAILAAIPK